MPIQNRVTEVRQTLARFQEGYTQRDLSRLDEFMELFMPDDGVELIGVGAAVRGGNEWFQGQAAVREIIESDWSYWGDVLLDVEGAKITVRGDVAWLSTAGKVVQTQSFDEALQFYLQQMQALLEDEAADADERLMEATHFGMRRLRERHKGQGYAWPFVLTAVLVRGVESWQFHTLHWSMPVD